MHCKNINSALFCYFTDQTNKIHTNDTNSTLIYYNIVQVLMFVRRSHTVSTRHPKETKYKTSAWQNFIAWKEQVLLCIYVHLHKRLLWCTMFNYCIHIIYNNRTSNAFVCIDFNIKNEQLKNEKKIFLQAQKLTT